MTFVCWMSVITARLPASRGQQKQPAKAVEMKNQIRAALVQIYRKLREWWPLVLLALIVPGGSLLALLILRRQHHHAHGSAP
jgi:hypothetical protein